MKKALILLMVVIMFGCMFCFISRPATHNNPVAGAVLDIFMPSVAFADSDTVGGLKPKPPPIK
jgi:hypothetical protein